MITEINALVHFLSQHTNQRASLLPTASLSAWLQARFQGHWHPSDPEQGSAYRSLDKHCLPQDVAQQLDLGEDYTLWVDPGCVCARFEARARLTCIYGQLPPGAQAANNTSNGNTMLAGGRRSSEADEEALSGFYSPVKSNRAIAIVPPSAKLAAPALAVAPPTPAQVPAAAAQMHAPTPVRPTRTPSPVSRSASAASSSGASSLFSAERRQHGRSFSSASSTTSAPASRPTSAQSFVKEHLNGKVGVLGGGIMLGQHAAAASVDDSVNLNTDHVAPLDSTSSSSSSAASSDSESQDSEQQQQAQQQQKPRRRREHRGKRGSGKQAARERALAQRAPRWCAADQPQHQQQQQQQHHHQAVYHHHQQQQQAFHSQHNWYMQPNMQYAY